MIENRMAAQIETHEHETTARPIGGWDGDEPPAPNPDVVRAAVLDVGRPLVLLRTGRGLGVANGGRIDLDSGGGAFPVLAMAPQCRPEQLGDPSFLADHGLRFPY